MSRKSNRRKKSHDRPLTLVSTDAEPKPMSSFDEVLSLLGDLEEQELRHLNQVVVERLKLFSKSRSLDAMRKFNVGDQVSFDYEGTIVEGQVVSLNQKSVSIITQDNIRWRVSPHLLSKVHSI